MRGEGVEKFRLLEAHAVKNLFPKERCVIATGGGTLMNSDSVNHLKQLGTLIYLDIDSKLLWERICKRGIPAYLDPQAPEQSFYRLVAEREPVLRAACSVVWKMK